MTQVLQSRWLAVAVGVIAYGVTTMLSLQPHRLIQAQATAADQKETAPRLVPSWQFLNPEMDQLLKELNTERDNLRTRAQQLEEWQVRLDAERQEMLLFTQKVFQLQAEMDRSVTRIREDEVVNLKKLAKMYAAMSPEGAAKILKEMDDDRVVKILVIMKESESAPLLETLAKENSVQAKRAAGISESIRLTQAEKSSAKPKIP